MTPLPTPPLPPVRVRADELLRILHIQNLFWLAVNGVEVRL